MRLRSICAFAVLAHATTANAEPLPNNATIMWPRMFIANNGDANDLVEPPTPEDFRKHLNLGSCLCSLGGSSTDTSLYYELTMQPTTGMNLPGKVFVGTQCDADVTTRNIQCHEIMNETAPIGDLDVLSTMAVNIRVPLIDLISPRTDQPVQCNMANGGTGFVWIVADTMMSGNDDFFDNRPMTLSLFSDVTGFDTQPPPLPTDFSATGGENSISINWEIPTSNAQDLFSFQAFCKDAAGQPVGNGGQTALYSTSSTICGIPSPLTLTQSVISNEDGTDVPVAPTEFENLDPGFLCGTQNSGTATNLTIEGLENGMEYTIGLVAVDFYGNPTGTFFSKTVIPKPVTDFWEDLHDRGANIEGGFCSAGGSDGALGLLLPVALAGLFVMRRKRRERPGASERMTLAALAIVLAPAVASADDFTPYWEDPKSSSHDGAGVFEDNVKWRAGIKLGPYTPGIDSQVGKNPVSGMGPYQAMFGNYFTDKDGDGMLEAVDAHVYQILPMLDVERVIWSGSGQVLVGGSIGYMQKSAFAYVDGTSPDDPRRLRSLAGKNTFRLIPLQFTASYRLTQLDDSWGIPVVPYVRGGLAYYIWWLKGPNGDISKICDDGGDSSDCSGNKALGGTVGFVGTLGVSIRAERIDADAARSMKNSGLYHAGFYMELNAGVVNGFGNDKKLSVGDTTWFAGFDFEF